MVESLILSNLIFNEGYGRKVIPFLKVEYFSNKNDRIVFNLINNYVNKYNSFPNVTALSIEIEQLININEDENKSLQLYVTSMEDQPVDLDWLVDQTEDHCKDKAIFNAISNSIKILDDKAGSTSKGAIPSLLEEALAVSFDTHIGHDFFDDAEERYEFYHRREERVPFDIEYLNKITKGGLPRKTLNVVLAGTGVGKSLFMCHCAAANLTAGKNVLYITMEMAEERIAERIDANLMNINLDQLAFMPRDTFQAKVQRMSEKVKGKLKIKEYPTGSAGAANFRHLLNELRLKKKFKPDIIYVDYLNICCSSRMKQGVTINSYTYIKAIAEEIRGLAVEFNVPIVSATQTTRSGFTSSDIGLEDTSESFGLPATVDFMIAMMSSEELEGLNQIMFKQLKNRYADPTFMKRFVVGIDKAKMRLFNAEQSAQHNVVDDSGLHNLSMDKKFSKETFKGFS